MISRSRRKEAGPRHFRAQATVELTIAFLASIILMLGVVKVFVWLNRCTVERQYNYQTSRTQLLHTVDPIYDGKNYNYPTAIPNTDFYTPPRINLFNTTN